ncbi:MAG: hypothetical protein J2P21_28540 [Chloracidobacterium sp.]|nr:hypothetical protein [Chloracidobacterium sp.]
MKNFTFAIILALGFVIAPGLSSLSAVQAQEEPRKVARRAPGRVQQRNAFREGFRSGWSDARRGLRPNPLRHQGYRMGDRLQRRDFRMGYSRGFRRV